MKPGIWSSFHNQACLTLYHNAALSFSYKSPFGLKDLGSRSICVILPSGSGTIGAFYSYFGYTDYRRETIGLAGGITLSPGLSAGVQADLFIERQAGDYENYFQATCEGGLLFDLSEKVRAGIHIFNPLPNSFRNVSLPAAIRAGAGVSLHGSLFAAVETEMITGRKINLKTGFEYTAGRKIILRAGYSSETPSLSFGLGLKTGPAILDAAFSTHPRLGITSCISVSFNIGKEKKN